LTEAAWDIKKNEILKSHPTATRRNFTYEMNRKDYYREFGKKRQKPGIFAAVLSLFIRIVPKIGPLRALKFKEPGPVAEKLYIKSFDTVMVNYASALKSCRSGTLKLANINFDTGNLTTPGEYGLADKNYDLLLTKLDKNDFKLLNDGLKQNIIDFYTKRTAPDRSRNTMRAWTKIMQALQQLKQTK
jgi:hypothetical protein